MTSELIEITLEFTNRLRPQFDTTALIGAMRDARRDKGLTIRQVAEACGVPSTEAEHWFRTDGGGAAPRPEVWPRVKALLGIEGWDVAGDTYDVPNAFDMSGRAYHEGGVAPTITTHMTGWIAREATE